MLRIESHNIVVFFFSDNDIIAIAFWHKFFIYIVYLQFYK